MDKNFILENAKNIIAEVSGVPVNTKMCIRDRI